MTARALPVILWAARENLRRPMSSILLAACLTVLTLALALVLLLSATLERTSTELIARAPDLVVRRLNPGGWQPFPADAALAAVHDLPGIVRAHPRVWGLAQSGDTTVTVLAMDPEMDPDGLAAAGITPPAPGRAVVGGWWQPTEAGAPLTLSAGRTVTVAVDTVLSRDVDLAAFDTVVLHPVDVRRLLGIPEGWASDLALYVFHPAEAEALRPELRRALPWPVHIRTRTETLEWYRSGFGRRSSLVVLLWLPALTALILVVLAVVQRQRRSRPAAGLLKALGWTTGDILKLHLSQALIVALPAVMLGLGLAYGLVGGPFTAALARVLLGWSSGAPSATLAPGSHPWVLAGVAVFILLPYLAAVLIPALRTAAEVPDTLLNEEH